MRYFLDPAPTWCDEKKEKGVQDELSGDETGISSILPLRFLFALAFDN